MSAGFLPKAGGYRRLRAFQLAEALCDLTAFFVKRFIPRGSRTCDQMEQAARSGKQNIAEGSAASATSKETEIKLTNVAKASLEELLLDYEDYLRQNSLPLWDKDHPRTMQLRNFLRSDDFMASPTRLAERYSAEEYCNLCISLIHQTTYLLRRLLEKQQQQFLETGGIKELMYRSRMEYRNSQNYQTRQTNPTGPTSHKKEDKL